jgi:23S rRNA (uracil1939-C5)-methyltransferase
MSKKSRKDRPVAKNKTYKVEITDLSHQGLGVAHIDGYPIFIENALPGETIKIQITHVGKRMGHAKPLEMLKKSPYRIDELDDLHLRSGTMPLMHLAYEKQLEFKQGQVEKLLAKVGGLAEVPVFETIGMDNPYGYRNKAQIPVREMKGQLTTGFYKKGTHELLPIEDFVIQASEIDEAIIAVRDILRKYEVTAYDEENHTGDVRHIVVRRGHVTGEVMIVLVTRSFVLPHLQEIVADIQEEIPEVVSIVQNINSEKTNVILGKQAMVLFGQDYYTDELMGHRFKISHQSFYQVNSEQTEKLYSIAVDYADLTGDEVVVDAYSGIGTMTLALAEEAGEVYGVEIVPQAIENAKTNASDNRIENVEFEIADAGDWLVKKAATGFDVDVVVVDPPRKGLAKEFIEAVLKMKPERMVYVSCNPSTLARDLKLLNEGGYTVEKAQPVDMFPQTYHIETIVKLTRDELK